MTEKKRAHIRVRDFDKEVWDRFHSHLKSRFGTSYGHVADELAKALTRYIEASELDGTQHLLKTSSTSDSSLRIDVQRNLTVIKVSLAKQFIADPNVQWHHIADKALTAMLQAALRKDVRTRRRYAARLKGMGVIRMDPEDPEFVYVSASWLFSQAAKQHEEPKERTFER